MYLLCIPVILIINNWTEWSTNQEAMILSKMSEQHKASLK